MELLTSIFGFDYQTYTVLSNYCHIVLRSRPDVVKSWSDEEVAQCWMRLYQKQRDQNGNLQGPTKPEIAMIMNNPDRIDDLTTRTDRDRPTDHDRE
jgi:hypothetical protein